MSDENGNGNGKGRAIIYTVIGTAALLGLISGGDYILNRIIDSRLAPLLVMINLHWEDFKELEKKYESHAALEGHPVVLTVMKQSQKDITDGRLLAERANADLESKMRGLTNQFNEYRTIIDARVSKVEAEWAALRKP